jgi:pyruvate kinase
MATKLYQLEVGHIYPIRKAYFRSQTYMDIKQYLSRVYEGEFVLLDETKVQYIVKRVKRAYEATNTSKEVLNKCWRFYIPQRKVCNRKMGGNSNPS